MRNNEARRATTNGQRKMIKSHEKAAADLGALLFSVGSLFCSPVSQKNADSPRPSGAQNARMRAAAGLARRHSRAGPFAVGAFEGPSPSSAAIAPGERIGSCGALATDAHRALFSTCAKSFGKFCAPHRFKAFWLARDLGCKQASSSTTLGMGTLCSNAIINGLRPCGSRASQKALKRWG